MLKRFDTKGVWSAAPTPFIGDWKIDSDSVSRLMEHQLKCGVKGVFIGGTSGEGPWITQSMLAELAKYTAKAAAGRMCVAVQITDNSALRMIDNISRVADSGADIVVIAPPFFQMKPTQDYLKRLYLEVIEKSSLPVGLYHRGKHSSVLLSGETLVDVAMHENVVIMKDSSGNIEDRESFLNLKKRKDITLLNGDEFDCISSIAAGYDGLMLGGACFNGRIAAKIYDLTRVGKTDEAKMLQEKMNALMYKVFGGKDCSCWLAGQKQMLVEMGIFSTSKTMINYTLTDECAKAVREAFRENRSEILP